MMKEFQEENERRRTTDEENLTLLLNSDSNEIPIQPLANEQSTPSTPTKTTNQTKVNTQDRRSNIDRNKLNIKTNRFTSDASKVRYFQIHLFI